MPTSPYSSQCPSPNSSPIASKVGVDDGCADSCRFAAELARVGGWELDVKSMNPVWSKEARRIHQRQWDASLSLDDFVASYPRVAQKALGAVLEGHRIP